MTVRPEDYVNTKRDSIRENALCDRLRQLSDDEVAQFVLRLLELDPTWGLPIALRVLRRPDDAERVLKLSTEIADVSTMKFWLKTCLPKMGWKRLLNFVRNQIGNNPEWVEDALYWLPTLRKTTDEEKVQLEQIRDRLSWPRGDTPPPD